MAEDDQDLDADERDEDTPHDDAVDASAMPPGFDAPLLAGYVNLKGMAKLLGVNPRTIRRWREQELLPPPDFQCGATERWKADKIKAWHDAGGTRIHRAKVAKDGGQKGQK